MEDQLIAYYAAIVANRQAPSASKLDAINVTYGKYKTAGLAGWQIGKFVMEQDAINPGKMGATPKLSTFDANASATITINV